MQTKPTLNSGGTTPDFLSLCPVITAQSPLLSRPLTFEQEEERKFFSRDLHDLITRTLTDINLRLATLKADTTINPKDRGQDIACAQQLVEQSVNVLGGKPTRPDRRWFCFHQSRMHQI
jgi:hypothetical protein